MRIDIGEWQVRSFHPDDAEALTRYANNPNVSRSLRDAFPYPYARSDAEDWISYATGQSPETNFAIASPTEAIGGIGLWFPQDAPRGSAEIGYWLGESFWGRGIATAALQALTEYAFAQLGLVRITGCVYPWNPASARVMEKAGYVCEGRSANSAIKDGQPVDQLLYAITR